MPYDEEKEVIQPPPRSSGLKSNLDKSSMFNSIPKKPSLEDFEKNVNNTIEKNNTYKKIAADLTVQFKKIMEDKTLPQNKNILSQEYEKEILTKMVQLAIDINNDSNESEGMGSLGWIVLLFKTCMAQKDKINLLEYRMSLIEKNYVNH